MKTQLSSTDIEDDYESSSSSIAPYCWWRSAADFDECLKIKIDLPNVSSLTPRVRVYRELERLALVAPEGLNELRHKLLTYRSGDFWLPVGGIRKEDMDIPPVITILLVGFSGSGKSSLVNLMYSVLGRCGLIPFAQTSLENSSSNTTTILEEHNVLRSIRSGFCVYDSRGFEYKQNGTDSLEQILSSWMNEGVHHNQLCLGSSDENMTMKDDETEIHNMWRSTPNFVRRKVDCPMVVANIAEIYNALKAGDPKPLEANRSLFCTPALRKCNEKPILILTHGDLLTTEERIEGRLKVCESLGISETTGVYDIVCVTEYGFVAEESDPITAYALSEALYRALLISDRSHLPKTKLRDWALFLFSWLFCFIGAFFAFLADLCSKLGRRKLKLI